MLYSTTSYYIKFLILSKTLFLQESLQSPFTIVVIVIIIIVVSVATTTSITTTIRSTATTTIVITTTTAYEKIKRMRLEGEAQSFKP